MVEKSCCECYDSQKTHLKLRLTKRRLHLLLMCCNSLNRYERPSPRKEMMLYQDELLRQLSINMCAYLKWGKMDITFQEKFNSKVLSWWNRLTRYPQTDFLAEWFFPYRQAEAVFEKEFRYDHGIFQTANLPEIFYWRGWKFFERWDGVIRLALKKAANKCLYERSPQYI